ncbi:MAG TPA: ATP-binding protein [Steroidobacteraceae bacterium]
MNTRSLEFRLGAWYALLISVTFICVGAAAFYGLQHYLRGNLLNTLKRRVMPVEQVLMEQPPGVTRQSLSAAIEARIAPEINNRFVRVSRSPGGVWYASGAPADDSFEPQAVPPGAADTLLQAGHLLVRATDFHAPSGNYLIEVGVPTAAMLDALEHLLILLILLIPALIVCAAAGGYFLVNRALRPVDRLSRTAEQLSLQNLTLRLPVLQSGDALERLSLALNNMLARLRDSVLTSRRFLADASHELRTPLTIIKGELQEVSRTTTLTSSEMRERVGSVLEEVDRLEHLVSGLLALSRLDAGEARREWRVFDLAPLARTTAEQMRLMAEDRGLTLEIVTTPATVCGEAARIKQVIVNLLGNAIRFTPPGGTVSLRVLSVDDGSVLEVRDTGVGIPAAALPRVFDRFYRVNEGRSREDGGAGLGLSIVRAICVGHGAEIAVESRLEHGSCFRVHFPQHHVPVGEAPFHTV